MPCGAGAPTFASPLVPSCSQAGSTPGLGVQDASVRIAHTLRLRAADRKAGAACVPPTHKSSKRLRRATLDSPRLRHFLAAPPGKSRLIGAVHIHPFAAAPVPPVPPVHPRRASARSLHAGGPYVRARIFDRIRSAAYVVVFPRSPQFLAAAHMHLPVVLAGGSHLTPCSVVTVPKRALVPSSSSSSITPRVTGGVRHRIGCLSAFSFKYPMSPSRYSTKNLPFVFV
ncbi:hypothetical protein FB451DRAFT_1369680 [Mycena latifolia]|nr:hypothetical protein FB451DRAFT_1369680 [Mycena latifolia]